MRWVSILSDDRSRRRLQRLSIILGCLVINASWTVDSHVFAGLIGPSSYYVVSPNGKYIFVMLAPANAKDDVGATATLPTGESANLRKVFPASGCYRVGSKVPQWTVDWFDYVCRISDNGNFLVRCNLFGDGDYGTTGQLSWGVKFYRAGREIKSYNVDELVAFPFLMPYTTSGWHYMWIDDESEDNLQIRGNTFTLRTSTGESYKYDIRTGELIESFRLWPTVLQVAWALLPAL